MLAEYRKKSGLTQKEAADKLGISRSYYALLENGHKIPQWDLVDKISKMLGEWLLGIFPSDDPINRTFMEDERSNYAAGFPVPLIKK